MSELVDALKEAQEESREMNEKQYKLTKKRIETQYQQLEEQERLKNAFNKLPIGKNVEERYKKLAVENTEYIKLARDGGTFLGMDVFKDKVALFARNLILLSAETGTGKSTTVANFVESYLKQNKKIIIVTNEENPNDILNRILFLLNDWIYSHHDQITDEQLELCEKAYPKLGKVVEVIHDQFNGIGGTTTTLEGIKSVCQNLIDLRQEEGITYDAIIIDYIQNISSSIEAPSMAKWQVMQKTMTYLDNFKNVYDAPVLVFSQLKSNSGDASYKDRLEGYKAIINHATTAIEIKIDRENLRTEWLFVKNRFKSVGSSVFTGFDKGRYVEYDQEFKNRTLAKVEQKKHQKVLGNLFKKENK